jgi:SRSO17 transposase
LTPAEVAALADERVPYQAVWAERYARKAQAHGGYKSLHGLMRPMECKSRAPMTVAWDGGDVQAMQPRSGQGQWQAKAWLPQPWVLVDETLGAAHGVGIVDGADVPTQGGHAVGVARQWDGRLGKVEPGQAGGCAA